MDPVVIINQGSQSGTLAAWVPFFATVFAAAVAALLARRLEISKFRQIWINELRSEISEYIRAAYRWQKTYDEIDPDRKPDEENDRLRERSDIESQDAKLILHRIRMRFNPDPGNKYYAEDEDFLRQLGDLLNPGKLREDQDPRSDFFRLADPAVQKGREILKREWEVTKGVWAWVKFWR